MTAPAPNRRSGRFFIGFLAVALLVAGVLGAVGIGLAGALRQSRRKKPVLAATDPDSVAGTVPFVAEEAVVT